MQSTGDSNPHRARAARRLAIPSAIALAGLSLFATGCGSSSPNSSSSQAPKNIVSAAYRYSSCMRDHGVTNFPNPQVSSSPGQTAIRMVVPSTFAGEPQFKSAQKACRGLLPGPANVSPAQQAAQEHAREQVLLAFAQCLRHHGLTSFPDPTAQGQLTLEMIRAAGVDLQAPGVLNAGKACIGVTHGLITLAAVERAVNGGQ